MSCSDIIVYSKSLFSCTTTSFSSSTPSMFRIIISTTSHKIRYPSPTRLLLLSIIKYPSWICWNWSWVRM